MTAKEYNQCVSDHADGIYRFILKNIRDEARAQDVVQDTFEKLWNNHPNVDAAKSRAYLFTTAYHTLIDTLRRDQKQTGFEKAPEGDFTDNSQYSDLKEILDRALATLPAQQRNVILLRDYEGYAYDEIGEITGLTESQVKVYIYRARVKLKRYIGKMETLI